MQQMVRTFGQRLSEILFVKCLHIGVFMRETKGHLVVKSPQDISARLGALLAVVNRLTAAAGAAAGTCHNFHKIILNAAGLERLQKLSGVSETTDHRRADRACTGNVETRFLPALHAAHGGKCIRVRIFAGDQIVCAAKRRVREERLTAAVVDFKEKFGEKYGEDFDVQIDVCLYKMQKKVVKKWLLAGKRVDGRGPDDIRPLDAEVGVLPRVHGSGLFTRGQTQVLSVCTLNTLSACQKLDTIYDETEKRYIHHYNMPQWSTGEARAARSTSRREVGHGSLAEKALVPVLPSVEEFPYCIRVVSEVVSSNGSTSQASICGSTLALMDAGVPIKRPVAGISCGLISDKETGEWRTFTDIQGVEDFHGEMDFKVAGTTEGVTAIQMDLKNDGLTMEIIADALERCRKARLEILNEVMIPCIAAPRAEVSEFAPKMLSMKIDVDKIREVIGKGGATIQKIVAESGAQVDIDDDGTIHIASPDAASCAAAKKMIDDICFVPEVGKLYYGKVVRILPIGAFVELAPGKDGMIHISKLENRRVEKVEDVLNIGDMTWVKVTEIDEKGRVNLSRKDALKELANADKK